MDVQGAFLTAHKGADQPMRLLPSKQGEILQMQPPSALMHQI